MSACHNQADCAVTVLPLIQAQANYHHQVSGKMSGHADYIKSSSEVSQSSETFQKRDSFFLPGLFNSFPCLNQCMLYDADILQAAPHCGIHTFI